MDADELDWNRPAASYETWEYAGSELIHHLSEVCLLRDLYLHTKPATNGATR